MRGIDIVSSEQKPKTKTEDEPRTLGGIEAQYKSFPLMTVEEFRKNRRYNPMIIKP